VFIWVCHGSLSWARWIQSTTSHPTSLRFILILSSLLCRGPASGLFPSVFPPKNFVCFCHLPHGTSRDSKVNCQGVKDDSFTSSFESKLNSEAEKFTHLFAFRYMSLSPRWFWICFYLFTLSNCHWPWSGTLHKRIQWFYESRVYYLITTCFSNKLRSGISQVATFRADLPWAKGALLWVALALQRLQAVQCKFTKRIVSCHLENNWSRIRVNCDASVLSFWKSGF